MDEITVNIEAEINPTESEEKVKQAIENAFGSVQTKVQSIYKGGGRHPRELMPVSKEPEVQGIYKGGLVTAETKGLEGLAKLYNLLRRERIRDATRKVLYEGLDEKTITFCLNKQVAYAGHVSFSEEDRESPLGPIKVKITCTNPRQLIDWLAPKTS
jgi:predicted RNA binding protein with dsRBD fold (UPF0201 family)